MTPIDIRPADLETVRRILRERVPGLEVRAFGSRVAWHARETSDLDLALMTDEPLAIDCTAALRAAFTDSDLPFRVDIVDWATTSQSFRSKIHAHHVVIAAPSTPSGGAPGGERQAELHVETAGRWGRREVRDLIRDGVLVVGDGYRAKNSELSDSGLPFARAGNVADGFRFSGADRLPESGLHKVGDKTSRSGDVVFTSKGTVGRFAFVHDDTERFVYSPQLCFWRSLDREVIDPRFLHCWMRGPEFFGQFTGVAGQTDMAEYVSLTDQRRMFITLPPLAQQRTIAHILGTLDDKIELNRRMNATLEAMARALFRSWFVDFDPVRAKMEGRDPGLPQDIADLFPNRLADSELGEIPEGWRASTLAEVALLNPESWSSRNAPEHILYVDLATTKWGYIDEIRRYSWAVAPSRGRRVLRRGDTIVGTVRPGNGSFAVIDRDGLTGSTGFAVLRPKDSVGREIVWCAATSHDTIDRLAHLADGGAYPAVNPKAVLDTALVLPDARVRGAFSSLTAPLLDRLQENQREARTLGTVRDVLLPKLVSGELRVNVREQAQPADERSIATAEASA